MPSTAGGLRVRMLSDMRKVIPLYARDGEIWHTDVKLPDLVVANESPNAVTLVGVSIHAFAEDAEVCVLRRNRSLAEHIAEANGLLNRFVGRKPSPWRTYNAHARFAMEPPAGGDGFEETAELPPGAKLCLPLADLMPFHYAGSAKIDRILCKVSMMPGDTEQAVGTAGFEVPLTPYVCKGDYIFPLRGPVTIEGTPWSREIGHRDVVSQEFAFDVIDVRRLTDGSFALSDPAGSSDVADYFIFDREVRSIGDGVIVEVGNRWPDAFAKNPLEYSIERVTDLTVKLLDEGVPFNHAILGNYAVIDHRNGEFSLYAHMREGSVCVDVGDEVERGQVIGRVGNTSNSEGPHLHFHLMDGPDFRFANGLPVRFSDLPDSLAVDLDLPQPNSLLYSDYVFLHVP